MTEDITVLHVDDEGAYADLQKMYLEKLVDANLSTIITTDPGEVLDLIEDRSVDCVVCDYDMPDVDGLDVLSTVRADHPSLPFILLTGKGNEGVASEAIRMGATDYVRKPSGSKQYRTLGNRIRNAVVQYRRQREDHEEVVRLEAFLDRVTEPFLALDDDLRVTYGNEAATRMLGGSAASVPGTPILDLLPEDAKLETEMRRSLREQTAVSVREPIGEGEDERDVRIYPDEGGLSVLALEPDHGDESPRDP